MRLLSILTLISLIAFGILSNGKVSLEVAGAGSNQGGPRQKVDYLRGNAFAKAYSSRYPNHKHENRIRIVL